MMNVRKVGQNTVIYPLEDETISITVILEEIPTIVWSIPVGFEFMPWQAREFAGGLVKAAEIAEGRGSE